MSETANAVGRQQAQQGHVEYSSLLAEVLARMARNLIERKRRQIGVAQPRAGARDTARRGVATHRVSKHLPGANDDDR